MNRFGKKSEISVTASLSSSGKTFVSDSFFTSPFKIMKPFERGNGISVFVQAASAGIMAGDEQEHRFFVKDGANLEIKSQSFEKIFKMGEGERAVRKIFAEIGAGATLFYGPLPCIPFAESSFSSCSEISLSDSSSRLLYEDILCAGRVAHGERFDYAKYENRIKVRRGGVLVFRENAFFEGSDGGKFPSKKDFLQSPSVFGSFTHSGTLLLFGFEKSLPEIRKILSLEEKLLYTHGKPGTFQAKILCEASETGFGDIVIRALAHSAEAIQNVFDKIKPALAASAEVA